MIIKFDKPAKKWGEALPIGNGHLGGMVYSGLGTDRIDLSENTFFSGERSLNNNQKDAYKAFYKMRKQLQKEEFEQCLKTSEKFIGNRHNYGTNLPVGTVLIKYGNTSSKIENYQRELDIERGIVQTKYEQDDIVVKRTVFISHPHKVMVYKVSLDKNKNSKMKLNLDIGIQGYNEFFSLDTYDGGLEFEAKAYEQLHSDGASGVILRGAILPVTDGIVYTSESIQIKDATEITLYIGTDTNCLDDRKIIEIDRSLKKRLKDCLEIGYEIIKNTHIEEIRNFMSRVSFNIEGKDSPENNINKIPFMFQYGRYLLLSSSREDSKLPAHLQGIWNDNVACRIGWTCDMHLDINTQMNYMPSEITNLSEVNKCLFRWIEEDLMPSGKITAKESYGLDGWVAELVSNAWGFTAPYWASPIAPCPTGGVWILTHMWEHFLYSHDKGFLEDHGYPVIRESVKFFSEYVFEENGYFSCGPSISPENSFQVNDKSFQISNGCTYELLMIRELFSIYLKASEILEKNDELVTKVRKMIHKLRPYRILEDGTLAEWAHDYLESDFQHRHTSHLLGLYPFHQITVDETPKLAKAAKVSIAKKLSPISNWEDTGWARALLTLYSARLREGEEAYRHLESMLNNLLQSNFMIIHPPTRGAGSFDNVYELDGNTGFTTAVAEMLLQSNKDRIYILPAIPEDWKSGHISGLVAYGGIQIAITWEKEKQLKVELFSKQDIACVLCYMGREEEIILEKEKVKIVQWKKK